MGDRQADVAGKGCCGLGGVVRDWGVKGLKGPRGKGSTEGRGGSLRSSVNSKEPLEEKEFRMLQESKSEMDIGKKQPTHGREPRRGNSFARMLMFGTSNDSHDAVVLTGI